MGSETLGEFEQALLLAIVHLGDAAYGVTCGIDGLDRDAVSHLERWPENTPYRVVSEAAERVVDALGRPGLQLVVDAGVGEEVVSVLNASRRHCLLH